MLNLATILETSAREHPHKTAVVCGETRITYSELNDLASRVANGLRAAGMRAGDSVALACPNIPQFPAIYYGALKIGAVAVPVNVMYKRRELTHILKDSGARAFFCFEGTPQLPTGEEGLAAFEDARDCECFCIIATNPNTPPQLGDAVAFSDFVRDQSPVQDTASMEPDDTAVTVYTAATSGRPMGAELTHGNLMSNTTVAKGVTFAAHEDMNLIALPLFHMFGQTTQLNAQIMVGATLVLLPRFDAATALRTMQEEQITFFCAVPAMLRALVKYRRADKFGLDAIARRLRMVISGGEHLTPDLLEAFEERFKVPVVEGYGLTEAAPIVAINRFGEMCKPGSVGLPVPGTEVRLVDPDGHDVTPGESGELVVRGPSVMKGYRNCPDVTRHTLRDGWLHTGDLMRMDEDGYLFITGRCKDMVIRGGLNVYPREIELALMLHPGIADAAVLAMPSERHGEEAIAFVVPEQGEELFETQILAWLQDELARYKCPRRVTLLDALPRSESGELDVRLLRTSAVPKPQ